MSAPIGIVCATRSEIAPFLEAMDVVSTDKKAMVEMYRGTFGGCDVVATCCGICKTNAAMAVQSMIDSYGVSCVINAGTAGGMDPVLDVFDIAVGTSFAHHDVDAQMMLVDSYPFYPSGVFAADEKLLAAARSVAGSFERPVHFGAMASGEQFVDDTNRDGIVAKYSPISVDMESSSMAQVCFANGVARRVQKSKESHCSKAKHAIVLERLRSLPRGFAMRGRRSFVPFVKVRAEGAPVSPRS